jgi:predicted exporter
MSARWRAIVAALALAAIAGVYLAHRLVVETDFAAFLPHGAGERQQWLLAQLREGPAARLIIAGIAGGSADDRVATSRALTESLSNRSEFAYASNGSLDVAQKDLDALASHRYALSPAMSPDKFSEAGLRKAFEDGLASLQSGFAVLEKQFLFRDPTGETLGLLEGMARGMRIKRDQGVWVDAKGDRALLVLQTRATGSDLDGQSAAVAALDQAFAAVAKPGQTLVASSPGTMAVASRAIVERDARRVSILSAIGVLVVLLIAYRSIPVVAVCFVPAMVGLLVGVAVVQAVFGSVHAITLAFGATLLGESVDYPSYLLTSGAGTLTAEAQRSAVARSMGLAVATTACGSLALLMSGFDGLMQLGLLTAVGILAAGVATWWLVPSLVPPSFSFRPWFFGHPEAGWHVPKAVAYGVFAVLTIASLAFLVTRPPWDDDPARMNPLPSSLAAQDRALRESAGAPDARFFALVRAPTLDAALERAESLAKPLAGLVERRQLGGYTLVTTDLPSEATQRRRLAMLPDADTLRARVEQARQGLPYRPDAFAAFVKEAGEANTARPVRLDDYAGTGIGLRAQSLIATADRETRVIVPLSGVADIDAVRRALASDGVEIVDLRSEVGALLGAFRERATIATAIGVAMIYAILAIGLRAPLRAARVVAPAILAALWTLAAIAATGHALTIFHLIAALLVVGVGVNYMLFAFPARGERVSDTALTSLAVVSATTLCAFGAMATSSIPVLNALGVTVTLGVAATLAACALLVGAMRSRT